ncbi:DNA adenine methylase [Pseudomonas sp. BW13M1]|uniref:site-specific DNA-methyltransferase (adenine-specific) n=1 Tax=Pseudomonas peradeniyensis TaxID=2745488 RepID=A0A923G4Y7_9PSED|nr:DNA adenine methylase [Pseudomonas peradeniyensis]MBV4506507.1 DNA adenine methylase [Pseudomonas peradeniyensis]
MFRYFGSKASTAPIVADATLGGYEGASIADAFGGLGNIGAEFKLRGCSVTACDLLRFPNAFQHVRLVCEELPSFSKVKKFLGINSFEGLSDYLNSRCEPDSWFVYEYSTIRRFFSGLNAASIAGAWCEIAYWIKLGLVDDNEIKFLTASLLNSMDTVANTAGTYYAYLKAWDRKAKKEFRFCWYNGLVEGPKGAALYGDALDSLSGSSFDVLYLDPPYNSRDYSRYYHLPETLARFKEVEIDSNSMSGQPAERSKTGDNVRAAMKLPYLSSLIRSVGWRRLVVQYAEGAYISLEDLAKELSRYGSMKVHEVSALGYQSKNGVRKQTHHVFIVDK